ncbi:Hypothetical predicted protein, partial [Pelobates cultripes]
IMGEEFFPRVASQVYIQVAKHESEQPKKLNRVKNIGMGRECLRKTAGGQQDS